MADIIDFVKAAEVRSINRTESEQFERLRSHFLDIIADLDQSEIIELIEAIRSNDKNKYYSITVPLISHRVIREFNRLEKIEEN